MFIFLIIFLIFYSLYYYFSYQVILLNDLDQIFAQTAHKAQQDFDIKQYSDLVLEDLGKCYPQVLLIILSATVLTFAWILLLKYNAKIIIWLSIFSLPILLSIGLYFSVTTYINLNRHANSNNSDYESATEFGNFNDQMPSEQTLAFDKALQTILTAELISYVKNDTLWLVVSIVLFFILALLFIILHSLRVRVSLSIELIKQASKAINGVKSTLVFPIIPRAIGVFVLVYGILISLLIISASHTTYQFTDGPYKGQPCNPKVFKKPLCVMYQALDRKHVWKYHAINLFATLWSIHFISGISRTVLAGAFASYYWAPRKPQDVPFFAVSASLYRVIKNHLGDIAFGSFLIATIRYIRIVIEFIDNRIRKKSTTDVNNPTARSTTCFFRIFFWILERFLKYIDRNAYIIMSMYGEGYLASAKRAVELLYKNSTRALVLDYVTYFVLLVSRLLITGFAGYMTAQGMFTVDLHYKWLPIVLVVLGTYFISKGLFSVYSMAVDTLFICFLIDSTIHNGSAERPYCMSKELRRIMKRNTVF